MSATLPRDSVYRAHSHHDQAPGATHGPSALALVPTGKLALSDLAEPEREGTPNMRTMVGPPSAPSARLDGMTPQTIARIAGCAPTAVRKVARDAGISLPSRDDTPLDSERAASVLAALGAAAGVWFVVR